MPDIVTFVSDRFAPFLPDESQVNPGVYGAELAYWLSHELARLGIVTSYPEFEDWGWFIEFIPGTGAEFVVRCMNRDGTRNRWLLSLHRHGRALLGRNTLPLAAAAPVVEAIRQLIDGEPSVTDVTWLYSPGD